MRRREFLGVLGGALPFWPLPARAQAERIRRVGVLMNLTNSDPQAQRRIEALITTLSELGRIEGKNLHTEYRWGADQDIIRSNAAELAALAPAAIVANAPPSVQALQQVTRSIPLVFTAVLDPVALGF